MRRLSFLIATVAVAVALPLVAPPAGAMTDTTGSAGIGDRYFPTYGNGGYDVQHYRITDTYLTRSGRLTGRTVIQAVTTQPLRSFHLDFALTVDSVAVNGAPARFRQPDDHELVVTAPARMPRGRSFTVSVRYHGNPEQTSSQGLYPWVSAGFEAAAIGEPEIAAWWFPSNDHPRDKATFDITVRAPRGQQVVSNGVLASRTVGQQLTAWRWRVDQPMATYLAFFVVGKFRMEHGTSRGLPYWYAVSRHLPTRWQTQSLRLLRQSPRIVRWLADHYGPYPFSSTGGVVIDLFSGFALENQTRPVYPYLGTGRSATDTVVHELAHQWFGDAVSVNRWQDIWLNEGFASFAEWQWDEEVNGVDAAERLDRTYGAYPPRASYWSLRIANPGPKHLFDWPVYERGAMTLQALRNVIGDGALTTVLQTWVADHTGGTGRSGQFERLAEKVSGKDLSAFFRAWLRSATRPPHTAAYGLPKR